MKELGFTEGMNAKETLDNADNAESIAINAISLEEEGECSNCKTKAAIVSKQIATITIAQLNMSGKKIGERNERIESNKIIAKII